MKSGSLSEKLKLHDLRLTHQRAVIYNELIGDKTHPTTDDIYRRVRVKLPFISFDTVNRTLSSFAEMGVIKIVENNHKIRRYDSDATEHHHFLCDGCGLIVDFYDAKLINSSLSEKLFKNYLVITKKIVLTGLCDTCLKNNK